MYIHMYLSQFIEDGLLFDCNYLQHQQYNCMYIMFVCIILCYYTITE